MADFDVVFVGTGHNSLVCAAYLTKAGFRVGMLESRPVVGGAVVTQEVIPGFQFDLGGSAHILINHTPIVRELSLEKYGLDYIDLDPLFFAPFPDGERILVWKDIERTCESVADVSPEDAHNYLGFTSAADFRRFLAVTDSFFAIPSFRLACRLSSAGWLHSPARRHPSAWAPHLRFGTLCITTLASRDHGVDLAC